VASTGRQFASESVANGKAINLPVQNKEVSSPRSNGLEVTTKAVVTNSGKAKSEDVTVSTTIKSTDKAATVVKADTEKGAQKTDLAVKETVKQEAVTRSAAMSSADDAQKNLFQQNDGEESPNPVVDVDGKKFVVTETGELIPVARKNIEANNQTIIKTNKHDSEHVDVDLADADTRPILEGSAQDDDNIQVVVQEHKPENSPAVDNANPVANVNIAPANSNATELVSEDLGNRRQSPLTNKAATVLTDTASPIAKVAVETAHKQSQATPANAVDVNMPQEHQSVIKQVALAVNKPVAKEIEQVVNVGEKVLPAALVNEAVKQTKVDAKPTTLEAGVVKTAMPITANVTTTVDKPSEPAQTAINTLTTNLGGNADGSELTEDQLGGQEKNTKPLFFNPTRTDKTVTENVDVETTELEVKVDKKASQMMESQPLRNTNIETGKELADSVRMIRPGLFNGPFTGAEKGLGGTVSTQTPSSVLTSPTAAATVLDIQPNMQSAAWNKVMAGRVLWMAREGVQQAELKLNPANMGPVEVRLTINNDQASVTFIASQAPTREALEQSLPRLRDSFTDSGMELVDAEVTSQSSQHEQSSEQAADEFVGGNEVLVADTEVSEEDLETIQEDDGAGLSIYA
jgi:flagellar hook-length control protein FliK